MPSKLPNNVELYCCMSAIYSLNGWVIDLDTEVIVKGDIRHKLSHREIALTLYLCQHAGEVVKHADYAQACWPNQVVSSQVVNNMVSKIRRLFCLTEPYQLEAIRGTGYRLETSLVSVIQDSDINPNQEDQPYTDTPSNAVPDVVTQPSLKHDRLSASKVLVLILLFALILFDISVISTSDQPDIESLCQSNSELCASLN
ncbi:winged helix-turn-helix domain-containing protein [Vibrio hannami]|uniref:winged helix-turn-helix domain-containing protein n=1 Tax=Vibrio hannami TaxID=2717094 RepID=UPI00240F7037|nr:winged helix-turn-helix domain-containing protein [Vibrio hannami]MDG3087859.1 winged helix-turn-helix domain-containing protein [Vibrio hannami]